MVAVIEAEAVRSQPEDCAGAGEDEELRVGEDCWEADDVGGVVGGRAMWLGDWK